MIANVFEISKNIMQHEMTTYQPKFLYFLQEPAEESPEHWMACRLL